MFVAGVLSGLAERPYIYGMQRLAEPPKKSGSLKRWPGAKFWYSVIAYTETSEIFWTSAQTREISGPCQTREFFGEILGRDPFYPPMICGLRRTAPRWAISARTTTHARYALHPARHVTSQPHLLEPARLGGRSAPTRLPEALVVRGDTSSLS